MTSETTLLPPSDREALIEGVRRTRYIKYPRAEEILAKLEDLSSMPRSHRMTNLLLVGETNNGKSMIVNRFAKRHKPEIHFGDTPSSVPVVLVQAPPVPDESRFYNAILTGLYAPFRPAQRVDEKQAQVLRMLDAVGVRILIIDEIHHVLAGTAIKQRQFLNVIKYLGNELRIPIVAVGTRDAFNAIHSDPQLANRFEPALLPRWQMDEEYLRLLASFETLLPLTKASQLTEPDLALKILSLSEGTIGEIATLLTRAATSALRGGEDRITSITLDRCGYVAPSARRRATL